MHLCRGKDQEEETDRQLRTNDHEYNSTFHYVNNYIRTSKYTLLTFLPMNLFEQFRRIANLYFLMQIVIMSIPKITALSPEATAVPLVIVLAATGVKDAVDDFKRHRSDNEVNNRKAKVLQNNSEVTGQADKQEEEKWMKLQVGDVLRIDNNDQIPADIVVLTTSEENGLCYIETAELDGETNLKCRQPLPETTELGDDEDQLSTVKMEISCEPPNNRLDKFKGKLVYEEKMYPLENENVILRGCVLRNTHWVYGAVIYAGHDTKLMMNTGVSKFKRTGLDKLTNSLILLIALCLAIICTLCSIGTTVWEEIIGQHFQIYLPWEDFYKDSVVIIGIVHWPSFVMVLNTLIPISLYISIEVIRLGQSLWINWDASMYYEIKDTPALSRTTTLTEELGQIQYIFSDKTGTLTQNVMTFKKCSINGRLFGAKLSFCLFNVLFAAAVIGFQGHIEGENAGNPEQTLVSSVSIREEGAQNVDFSENPYADGKFRFTDQTLMDEIGIGNKECQEFFRLLAVCHTVMVESNNGKLEYQAQSPDEAALVTAARNFGFVFVGRSPTTLTIDVIGTGEKEMYELLAILDFNNERKRMSVIVKRDDQIRLYCKGADTIVYERLDRSCKPLMAKTMQHLNMFAVEGLRTLVTAYKDIPMDLYKEWETKYKEASLAMENRDELIQQVYEDIEQNLILLGATAIEDKLQDDVPDTIATLAAADIKIWVLTGDKVETAINIGYSCHLLTDDMTEVFKIEGESLESVQQAIEECKGKILGPEAAVPRMQSKDNSLKDVEVEVLSYKDNFVGEISQEAEKAKKAKETFGLVIPGKSLAFALQESLEKEFLSLACLCKAVICCRVTPLQKALVVQLVKNNLNAVTLAIGDGANDVSMIKAAHIGVGISGQEGMQAVLASDFSFGQFKYLQRLLLVHGRWSYFRMSKFLNYFFYKNFAFTLCQLWYAFFTGFSAQTVYDAWFISFYNVLFTSAPIVFLAVLDQDVSEKSCAKHPRLYIPGQTNQMFNRKIFFLSLLYGTLTSLAIFFISYGVFQDRITSDGLETSSVSFFGTVLAAILVVVVNIEISFITQYWTWINHFFIWGSILFYFVFYFAFYAEFVFNIIPQGHYYGMQFEVYGNGAFWFCLLLVLVVTATPRLSYHFIANELYPSLSDKVRRQERHKRLTTGVPVEEFKPRLVRRRSSKRSSYAFAHQEGFGKVVMSPASFLRKKLRVSSRSKTSAVDAL